MKGLLNSDYFMMHSQGMRRVILFFLNGAIMAEAGDARSGFSSDIFFAIL